MICAMTRGTGVLLVLVGLLVGVLLGAGGTLAVQHAGDDEVTQLEDIEGYSDAHDGAALYCTLGGVVPGMTGLDDPKYLNCVERETRSRLVQAGNDEADTAPSRLDD